MISIHNDLAFLYEKQGKTMEVLKYERLHKQISDSVFNTEKSQQITETQTKYETEKKEKEIQLFIISINTNVMEKYTDCRTCLITNWVCSCIQVTAI